MRVIEVKRFLALLLATVASLSLAAEPEAIPYRAPGQVPPGYPAEYAATIAAAESEGRLVIYSTTDLAVASEVLDDFRRLYPRIEVDYQDLNSTELHYRFLAETQLGHDSADIVWSSAMDQQASLIEKGYARAYPSPEAVRLPAWAVWKDQGFCTTSEPIAMVYNKQLLEPAEVPRSHGDLTRLISAHRERFAGRIVTYDIERSGVGFLLATQDALASQEYWDLARALGASATRFRVTTEAMLKDVAAGRALIAYNVLGSYALAQARRNPALGIVFPEDYTLLASRVMFISGKAKNPNAAKLWVDYLLSRRGQESLATRAQLYAVRGDVAGENSAAALQRTLGASLRFIPLGPELTGDLEGANYRDFVSRWRQAVKLTSREAVR